MNKQTDQMTKAKLGENALGIRQGITFYSLPIHSPTHPLTHPFNREFYLLATLLAFSLRQMQNKRLQALLLFGLVLVTIEPARALPNAEDTPEEVLRSEIITGARSPIDGKPMTASEYAQLQAELQTPAPSRPQLGRTIEKNLNLLRLRKFIKTFFPFLPVP